MVIGGLSVALMAASLSVGTHYLTNRLVNASSMDAPAGGNSNINVEYTSNATISEDQTITSGSYDSSYEGTINGDNTVSSITLSLDATSSLKLTGDTYVTSLENADSTNSNIDFNGYILYVNGVAVN